MYITPVSDSDNYIVNHGPMFGARRHPGCCECIVLSEEAFGDNEIVFCTLGQEENPTGADLSFTLFLIVPLDVQWCPEVQSQKNSLHQM